MGMQGNSPQNIKAAVTNYEKDYQILRTLRRSLRFPPSEGSGSICLMQRKTIVCPEERNWDASAIPALDGSSIEAAEGTATKYDACASATGAHPETKVYPDEGCPVGQTSSA